MVTYALVTSRLSYRSALEMCGTKTPNWYNMPQAHTSVGASRKHHVISILQELHWLLVPFSAQFKILILIYMDWNSGS